MLYRLILSIVVDLAGSFLSRLLGFWILRATVPGLRSSLRQSPPYTASDPRWLAGRLLCTTCSSIRAVFFVRWKVFLFQWWNRIWHTRSPRHDKVLPTPLAYVLEEMILHFLMSIRFLLEISFIETSSTTGGGSQSSATFRSGSYDFRLTTNLASGHRSSKTPTSTDFGPEQLITWTTLERPAPSYVTSSTELVSMLPPFSL